MSLKTKGTVKLVRKSKTGIKVSFIPSINLFGTQPTIREIDLEEYKKLFCNSTEAQARKGVSGYQIPTGSFTTHEKQRVIKDIANNKASYQKMNKAILNAR